MSNVPQRRPDGSGDHRHKQPDGIRNDFELIQESVKRLERKFESNDDEARGLRELANQLKDENNELRTEVSRLRTENRKLKTSEACFCFDLFGKQETGRSVQIKRTRETLSRNKELIEINYSNEKVERYTLDSERVLGVGAFGVVYKAKRIDGEPFCAFKIIDLTKLRNRDNADIIKVRLQAEMDIQFAMNHSCLLKLFGCYQNHSDLFLRLVYCDGNSISSFMKQSEKALTRDQAFLAFHRLLRAVEYMHSRDVLHRDIKLQNMLLKYEGKFETTVLGDFGLAIDLNKEQPVAKQVVGTSDYLSPELKNRHCATSKQSDVWACGVAFYKMLTGVYPAESIGQSDVVGNNGVANDASNLIKRCLHVDKQRRLSASELLEYGEKRLGWRHQKRAE